MLRKIIAFLLTVASLQLLALNLHSAEINLPRSGQTTSYASGDDGAVMAGLAAPSPRFIEANGRVVDNLTGLIWLQNANCKETINGVAKGSGYLTWFDALSWSNSLASGKCGLTDGSTAGQWRLPTRKELQTITDASKSNPAIPAGHPFSNVQISSYWSSTTYAESNTLAWFTYLGDGAVDYDYKTSTRYVWSVKDGE